MINYTEKGIGLHEAIQRAGHWLVEGVQGWQSSDDAAVQAIIDGYDPLPKARVKLREAIHEERIKRQQRGKQYVFPDGQAGTIQTRFEQDLLNINGLVTRAILLKAQGVADSVMQFRDAENVTHSMTPDQIIALGVAASDFVAATYAAKWVHDQAATSWDGSTEYDYLTGWPEG